MEGEELQVIEDGDMEDWVKVHKYTDVAVTQMCLRVRVTTTEALSHKLCVFGFTALHGVLGAQFSPAMHVFMLPLYIVS